MIREKDITEDAIQQILETVTDPEVPVLSIIDLGIIRKIEIFDAVQKPPQGGLTICITPTYTGCPAMDVIKTNIRLVLLEHGFNNVEIKTILSPAWTTDWMTQAGKQKLKAYGIAPPNIKQQVCTLEAFQKDEAVQCPHCNSYHTHLISRFGSTPCKALYKCDDCLEPFDYFKCH
ncbi:1,2-phenylacetyl-CoA epoxidase subunit PaaD [Parafilimonas sp.]|uniref:1,2-phenylacetyl-CoA epoxidase subunit PaaD n=1 Tax=Parafilimonas sp. TaxID=1969739 RepID=UPI003F7E694C